MQFSRSFFSVLLALALALLPACVSSQKYSYNKIGAPPEGVTYPLLNMSGLTLVSTYANDIEIRMQPGGLVSKKSAPEIPTGEHVLLLMPAQLSSEQRIFLIIKARDPQTKELLIACHLYDPDSEEPLRIFRENFNSSRDSSGVSLAQSAR